MKQLNVALVHDYLKEYGGAERVLETLHELYPKAVVYTAIYLPEYLGPHRDRFSHWDIRTTWLQQVPFCGKLLSPFRLLAPFVFRSLDLSQYDVVITSTAGTYTSPNFVKTGEHTLLISYCHTPPRYLYGYATAADWNATGWKRLLKILGVIPMHLLRLQDFQAAQLPNVFIANSQEVAERIKKFYRREAVVIYPPVDTENLKIKTSEAHSRDYFLAGGRLARPKRVDLAIKACTKLGFPLKVFGKEFAGYGEELRQMAGKSVEFVGEVSDKEKEILLQGAKAYLFPAEQEDFGILPVEAMAAGTPVIAYRSGGVQETVVEGKTGLFFDEPTVDSLVGAIKKFENMSFSSNLCVKRAEEFSKERFQEKIRLLVERNSSSKA